MEAGPAAVAKINGGGAGGGAGGGGSEWRSWPEAAPLRASGGGGIGDGSGGLSPSGFEERGFGVGFILDLPPFPPGAAVSLREPRRKGIERAPALA